MKSRTLTSVIAIELLTALMSTVGLAAQGHHQERVQLSHYSFVDLGTLGGTFSEGVSVNNKGSVSGKSKPSGDQVFRAYLRRNGTNTDLGTLGGPNSGVVEDNHVLNEQDAVVGFSDTNAYSGEVGQGFR